MLILLVFNVAIIAMIICEYKMYKTIITPFSLISLVYLALININNVFAAEYFGVYEIEPQTIGVLFISLIVIFIISMSFRKIANVDFTEQIHKRSIIDIICEKKMLILVLFLIGLIGEYISLYQCISAYGISNIKGKESGIFAHIGTIAVVLNPLVVCLGIRKKNIFYLGLVGLSFVSLLIFGGKYEIFIAFLHIVLFNCIAFRVNIRTIVGCGFLVVILAVVVFVFIYAVRPLYQLGVFTEATVIQTLSAALQRFFYYLLSPVVAGNYMIGNSIDFEQGFLTILAPFINLFKAYSGNSDYVIPILPHIFPYNSDTVTNVGGIFFESYYLLTGFSFIYIYVIFTIIYALFIHGMKKDNFLLLSSYVLAVASLLFFCNFFTVSGVIIQFVITIALQIIVFTDFKIYDDGTMFYEDCYNNA